MANDRTALLIQTKLKLAEKYTMLGMKANSKPNRVRFRHHAKRFRRQAEELSRTLPETE